MTRNEMLAEVHGYLANADQLPTALLVTALNAGVWSVFRRARNTRHFQQVREKFLPLVADLDEYDPGPEVETLVAIYRQDQGGARAFSVDPRREEEADRIYDEQPSCSYVPLANGRIRLLEMPATSSTDASKDGLRILFRPRPVPLTDDDQVPDIPEATHEAAVVEAIARLRLQEGMAVVNPEQFERFRSRVSKELDLYLTPSLEDSRQPPPDSWGFYEQEGSI